MTQAISKKLSQALWRIYNRPQRPSPWAYGGNLPWDDPDFSVRMLREHLDESHGAASRRSGERAAQINWMWDKLGLQAGQTVFDVTCGPGLYAVELARRGCHVTGVDFSPAAMAYAQQLAADQQLDARCQFVQADARDVDYSGRAFDAAMFLYGQLTVFTRAETESLLAMIARSLRPGGALCVEILNQDKLDKRNSRWWYTDDTGLWGDTPYLHLGERFWYEEEQIALERFHILHLETGQLDEIQLCDQAYSIDEMTAVMRAAGFTAVSVYPAWEGIPLYDLDEWVVYVARR
ncbi:MAG: class I SAM-dependent methyltransferase [Anaerolinea sp.]|nr:class I SAM-dependent methyltransferase [Anaerolinea sp.]